MIKPSFIQWSLDLENYCEGFQHYRRLYYALQNKGMACFDEDGYMDEVWGADIITPVLEYYLEREYYDRCAVLRDLRIVFWAKYGESCSKHKNGDSSASRQLVT